MRKNNVGDQVGQMLLVLTTEIFRDSFDGDSWRGKALKELGIRLTDNNDQLLPLPAIFSQFRKVKERLDDESEFVSELCKLFTRFSFSSALAAVCASPENADDLLLEAEKKIIDMLIVKNNWPRYTLKIKDVDLDVKAFRPWFICKGDLGQVEMINGIVALTDSDCKLAKRAKKVKYHHPFILKNRTAAERDILLTSLNKIINSDSYVDVESTQLVEDVDYFGYCGGRYDPVYNVLLLGKGHQFPLRVNRAYYELFMKYYSSAKWMVSKDYKTCVKIYENGGLVGLLAPMIVPGNVTRKLMERAERKNQKNV